MYTDLEIFSITTESTVKEAALLLDRNRTGITLVLDDAQKLVGTITDGDIRRASLAGVDLDEPIATLLEEKSSSLYAQPISAPQNAGRADMLATLRQHDIRHLPLVDEKKRVVAMVMLDEFVADPEPPMQAVIMAGGEGLRMRPLTDETPKPMLPVDDRPLMEHTVKRLRDAGIKHVNVAVRHKSEKITEHFGNGSEFGVAITYVNEDQPLGTAGAISLMTLSKEPVLVINGDVLTEIDFGALLAFHREHKAKLTVAVQRYNVEVPYGVVETDGPVLKRLVEKPSIGYLVNAGIYLLEPDVCRFISNSNRSDMTDLIQRLLDEDWPVIVFPIREYWTDIGQGLDYEQAQKRMVEQRPTP